MAEPSSQDCDVALELSRAKWLVGALLPGRSKVTTTVVPGGDTAGLLEALGRFAAWARREAGQAVSVTHNLNKYQLQHVPYDPLRDFVPVALLTRQVLVLVAATNQPFADTRALVARARAHPGEVGFGATEALTAFAGHEFNRRAGVRMEEVQYRGGSLLMNDIVARHLPTGWTSTASAMPHLATGRVQVLAVSTAERTPLLPDVPAVQEGGVPGYDVAGWVCVLGPPALPRPLAERVHAALARVYADPALQERFRVPGLQADLRGPAQLADFLKADDAAWAAAAAAGQIVKAQ